MQGAGKQSIGVRVNLGVCYCVGLPLALTGGFYFGWNVEGRLACMFVAPFIQTVIYSIIALRLDWDAAAQQASIAAAREGMGQFEMVPAKPGLQEAAQLEEGRMPSLQGQESS